MPEFVTVYSKTTGLKQSIPKKWLGHPVLGVDFELTPSQRASDEAGPGFPAGGEQPPADGKPAPDADVDELLQYAADHGIEVDDADDEAQLRALIDQHNESR